MGHFDDVNEITRIDFFVERGIKIKEIECGYSFTMVMDYDGRVWMFGDNEFGSIGDGSMDDWLNEPKQLVIPGDIRAEKIACGLYHCHVRCEGNKNYLWGDNDYNQCLVYDEDIKNVTKPHLIDFEDKEIKDICLGDDNTTIILLE